MEAKLTKSKTFLYACLGFILGVGLRSALPIPLWLGYIFFLLGLMALSVFWENKLWRIAGLGGIFLFFGILRFQLSLPAIDEKHIAFYNGEKVEFTGIITEEPDVRENNLNLTLESKKLFEGKKEKNIAGRVLVKAELYPEYNYGDELRIKCNLKQPENIRGAFPSTNSGQAAQVKFAYDKYLARYDIYSLCTSPEIRKIGGDKGNFVIKYLLRSKNYFVGTINKILPEPQASFLGGLLVGARRGIPSDLTTAFSRTGTTHIIAISGYNITIIAAILLSLARGVGLSRKKSFWFILAGIFFFVIITGASASVVRAAVMGGLVLLAGQLGRLSRITNALVLTAVVMLIANPKILVFDAGFQLSFLSTMGLVFFSPILEKYFERLPDLYGIKGSLTSTLSAIVFTTPLILYQFGRLSLVAPLANILVLPAIPWAMALGFAAAILGIISWRLGWVFGWLVWLVLSYIIIIVKGLGGLSWSAMEIKGLPWWGMLVLYSLITYWVIHTNKHE